MVTLMNTETCVFFLLNFNIKENANCPFQLVAKIKQYF